MDWEWLQTIAETRFDVLLSREIAESFIKTNRKRWQWVTRRWNTEPTSNDVLLGMLKIDLLNQYELRKPPCARPVQIRRYNTPLDDYDRVMMSVSYAVGKLYRDASALQEMALRRREEFIASMDCNEVFA